jgi:hypothetical protein
MEIQEIHRDLWVDYFNGLSRSHANRPVAIEAYGPGTFNHHVTVALPFAGTTYEQKEDTIEIIQGLARENLVSHTVSKPTHVWFHSDDSIDVVEIRSGDGVTFLLRFSAAS